MDIRQVNFSDANIKDEIPGWMDLFVDPSRCYCFVGTEEGEVVGSVVFQQGRINKNEINLIFMHVPEEARRQGFGTELLEEAESRIKASGIGRVVCKYVADDKTLAGVEAFLYQSGYEKLSSGNYLVYGIQDLLESALGKQMEKLKPLMDKVLFYDQIDKKARNTFKSHMNEKGIEFDEKSFDRLFSRFYTDNRQVTGFINLAEVKDNKLLLTDVFVDEGKDKKFVIPSMLASILKVAPAMLGEDAEVYFQLYDETLQNGVTTVFGEPKRSGMINEYMHHL